MELLAGGDLRESAPMPWTEVCRCLRDLASTLGVLHARRSPEALQGSPLDQRSDLYMLGALGYWLATGQLAYAARTIGELPEAWKVRPAPLAVCIAAQGRGDLPPPPTELQALIESLLSQQPAALRECASGEPIGQVARKFGVSEQTLYTWKKAPCRPARPAAGSKRARAALGHRLHPRYPGRRAPVSRPVRGRCV